jgi:hypothetical protein
MNDIVKPLLVGEANPYGSDPDFALYPSPPGCAGDRLCRLVMKLDPDDYLDRFDRMNICPSKWSAKVARERADVIASSLDHAGRVIVLLGAKVWSAFGTGTQFVPFRIIDATHRKYVVLPHPSGLSRAWHVPGAYERARSILREAGVLS